eukprot:6467807-Karenia_brevis.AAC.1
MRSKIMTLFDAAPGKKKVDAKEEKNGTTKKNNFDAIKEVVVLEGDQVETNAMFRLGRNAEQN